MQIDESFDVPQAPDRVGEIVATDATLLSLFPEARVEIVESDGNARTVLSHYTALGREGTATFHFTFESDGSVWFEKVCDGNVWRQLSGSVTLEPRTGGTRVRIEAEGRTKTLVPEFTIKGPMQDQIGQMAKALRARIEAEA